MTDLKRDLSAFKKIDRIGVTDEAWVNSYGGQHKPTKSYTLDEIRSILHHGSLEAKQALSRNYFATNGFYRRILMYYATLLTYSGILIPNPGNGQKLSKSSTQKRYQQALQYIDKMCLPETFTRMAITALVDGCYYGTLKELTKDKFILIDLPSSYCRTRFRDYNGNQLVEFDVRYFDSITDQVQRQNALKSYPKSISKHYQKYKTQKGNAVIPWILLPAETGLSFSFTYDCEPALLAIIPATIEYDEAREIETERAKEEIRKIIVQQVPHLADGQLLFEPDEALEMHAGTVQMMKGNENLSVLTTYADVEAVTSKTAADTASDTLDNMLQNIYSQGGVSSELFAPTGGQSLATSIKNDLSLMMILGNKFARFIGYVINELYSNSNVRFTYKILPFSLYTRTDDVIDSFKLAQSGYSALLPGIAMGLNQNELINVKHLENTILEVEKIFIPLQSAYTQSAKSQESNGATEEGGAPEKELEDKSPKTLKNEEALNN